MTDKGHGRDFHAEIDDAIDTLFSPKMGGGQAANTAVAPEKPASPQASAAPTTEKAVVMPTSLLSGDGADAFSPFEEALLSLDWEISAGNIEKARSCLKEIQGNFEVDKAVALAEIFSLMDRLLEAMAIAPQSVSTSAPKILQEGLQTLRSAAGAENLSLIEQTLIDPTLSELRSAVPNIPKDYSKMGQAVSSGTQGGSKPEPKAPVPAARVAASASAESAEEDLLPELPVVSSGRSTVLIDAVNAHLTVLGKCIAKRIVPVENLFAKTPGYEKLHAIHTELRERLEKQKLNLIKALDTDYRADAPLPVETGAGQAARSAGSTATGSTTAVCPWRKVELATWGGKTVAFLSEQIVYVNKPTGKARQCGPFLAIKNLKRGLFGKIGFVVQGEQGRYDEATLRTLTIPVAMPTNAAECAPTVDSLLLILFKENIGMAFWLDKPTETFDTSADCRWEPMADPNTLVAGNLKINGQIVPVITLRGV